MNTNPDRDTLRQRIAKVLRAHASLGGTPARYELPFFDGATPGLSRISGWRPLDDVADAVLAVLPEPTDRAAILTEAADAVAADTGFHIRYGSATDYAEHYAALLRRLAAEAPTTTKPSCPDPIECSHEAALGQAREEIRRLGLMVDEYGAGASAITDKLRRVRDLHRETCIVARAKIQPGAFVCGMCVVLDAPALPLTEPAAGVGQDGAQPQEDRRG